ncbi:hypothetical protein GCM10009664_51540 [Kitasatospora gansuensis]
MLTQSRHKARSGHIFRRRGKLKSDLPSGLPGLTTPRPPGSTNIARHWNTPEAPGCSEYGSFDSAPNPLGGMLNSGSGASHGITDPLANIYAGLNYAASHDGAGRPNALSGTRGYRTGTNSASPDLALVGSAVPNSWTSGAVSTCTTRAPQPKCSRSAATRPSTRHNSGHSPRTSAD